MGIWRDPLDDLIADLEHAVPAAPASPLDIPPIDDYSLYVESILSRDPAERVSLAADPAVKRVQAYHERLAGLLRASESVEAPR